MVSGPPRTAKQIAESEKKKNELKEKMDELRKAEKNDPGAFREADDKEARKKVRKIKTSEDRYNYAKRKQSNGLKDAWQHAKGCEFLRNGKRLVTPIGKHKINELLAGASAAIFAEAQHGASSMLYDGIEEESRRYPFKITMSSGAKMKLNYHFVATIKEKMAISSAITDTYKMHTRATTGSAKAACDILCDRIARNSSMAPAVNVAMMHIGKKSAPAAAPIVAD